MNMFSSKDEVDNHVRKIFSVTKNQHYNDLQCYTVAKLYFDIKEYQISRNYIDRYIKTNENSRVALKLKGKIHEYLKEYEIAQKCYQTLYDLFSEESDISKACECLLKSRNICENKVKKLLIILEKNHTNNENYSKLKKFLSPNLSLEYSISEINALKHQIKNNASGDLKIRFLRILENQNCVVDSLKECCTMMDSSLINNYDSLRICLSIFRNNYVFENCQYKIYYCIILCSLLKNQKNVCEYDRITVLKDLMELLINETVDGIYAEIFGIFFFHLTSMAHCQEVKNHKLNDESLKAICNGYLFCFTVLEDKEKDFLSKSLLSWLKNEVFLIKSISSHILENPCSMSNNGQWLKIIGNLIFNNPEDLNTFDLFSSKINTKLHPVTSFDQFKIDLTCLSYHFMDLKYIGWVMMCYSNGFVDWKSLSSHVLNEKLCQFMGNFIRKIFLKVPNLSSQKKSPENMCRVDIIVFLIGVFMTYQKSFSTIKNKNEYFSVKSFIYPYFLWKDIYIPEVLHKWWESLCDFCLNNKRNTSIGSQKELLKNGIDSMQLLNNQMSEVLRLQLGRLLNDCAQILVQEADSIKSRSVEFFRSVLHPQKSSLFKSNQLIQTSVSRNYSFSYLNNSSSISEIRVRELFDTDNVSEEILRRWKTEAYLSVVDYYLSKNYTDYDELTLLVESAERINESMPEMFLMKSRVIFHHAQSMQSKGIGVFDQIKFNELMKSAKTCVNNGLEILNVKSGEKRENLYKLFQEQLNKINKAQASDYSIFEFSSSENSNSYNMHNHNVDQSTVLNHSYLMENAKIEQIQSNMTVLESSQNKINSEVALCHQQMKNMMKIFENRTSSVKSLVQFQNELFLKMTSKCADMSRNSERLAVQLSKGKEEKCKMEKDIEYLSSTIYRLKIENGLFQKKLDNSILAPKIINKVIEPELKKVNFYFEDTIQNLFMNASKQMQQIKLQEMLLPFFKRRQKKFKSNISVRKSHENREFKEDEIDMSAVSEEYCNSSSKNSPKALLTEETKSNPNVLVNLSKFSLNKWECPVCCCMNENDITSCPACNSQKPLLTGEKTSNPNVLVNLSKFSMNKWECPVCCCMNENDIQSCPACGFSKNSNVVKDISSGSKTETFGGKNILKINDIKYFSDQTEKPGKIIFGSNSVNKICEQNDDSKFVFGLTNKQFSEDVVEKAPGEGCEDDDVILIQEPFVTEEQKERARILLLPDHFFYFENFPDKSDLQNSESSESCNENYFNHNFGELKYQKSINQSELKTESSSDFDTDYKPIVPFPEKIKKETEEENSECIFQEYCKLYAYVGDIWKEKGCGEIKIIISFVEGKKLCRLMMRKEKVGKICCNQLIVKNCPKFIPMKNSTNEISWFTEDLNEGNSLVTERLAIKFKSETVLKLFIQKISELQHSM